MKVNVVGDHDRVGGRTPLGRRDENAWGDLTKTLHPAFLQRVTCADNQRGGGRELPCGGVKDPPGATAR
jgi:hypothetical protein